MAKKTAEKPGRKNSYKEVYCYNWQIENYSLVAAASEFRAEVEAEVEAEAREKAKADAQVEVDRAKAEASDRKTLSGPKAKAPLTAPHPLRCVRLAR